MPLTPMQIADARDWLMDCGLSDKYVRSLTPECVCQMIRRNYEGGIRQFIADGCYWD